MEPSLAVGLTPRTQSTERLHKSATRRPSGLWAANPGRDLAKAAPAVFVVPANYHFLRANSLPPLGKLLPGQVESCGRYQVIENDRMLFAPVKIGNRCEV